MRADVVVDVLRNREAAAEGVRKHGVQAWTVRANIGEPAAIDRRGEESVAAAGGLGNRGQTVCEFSRGLGGGVEEGQGTVWMVGKAAPRRGHLGSARAPDEGEGAVAQGRPDLRGVSTAQAGAIFAAGHIAEPMPTFNAPLPPNPGEECLRWGLSRRLVGAKVVHLLPEAPAVAHAAGQTSPRGERRKPRLPPGQARLPRRRRAGRAPRSVPAGDRGCGPPGTGRGDPQSRRPGPRARWGDCP